jgi:polysaccharide deacetylase 2 family uncharacterized protein YibQ
MFWPATNKRERAPGWASKRPAAVLCFLLLALLPGRAVPAVITVAELLAVNSSREIVLSQAPCPERRPGNGEMAFEEPAVFSQAAADQPSAAETNGCRPVTSGRELPRVAIIIDDMGHHRQLGAALLALEMNLTYSFLPHAPFSREQAEQAREKGHDILVHMPMEALDPAWDPGPGTLYLADPQEELARKVAQNLSFVPFAVGINNHMGSRFTEDEAAMRRFFKLLAGRELLFVDSLTSTASVAMATARAMGFKAARRQVFLDNVQSQEDICRQLNQLVEKAGKQGWAIGIGHPNQATLTALTRCRKMLLEQVRLVGIRELVR